MKKQTFFKTCRTKGKTGLDLVPCQGYIYDLQDVNGYSFKVALYYSGASWRATHYTTGLDFTPYKTDIEGNRKPLRWGREDLISELKKFDIKRIEDNHKVSEFYIKLVERIAEALANEQNQDQ